MDGERTVAWTFLAASSLVAGAAILKGTLPTYREIFGVTGAWLLMAFAAKVEPKIAGALSLLVLTTITLERAGTLLSSAQRLLLGGSAKTKAPTKQKTTAKVRKDGEQ